ncbi:hypothetical protein GQ602_005295 [Ophiocordyceps camponoti-floridani]|uniref:Uncharacterized protein n=1 Tax=Ophiocordyceps camponoti-floridani TaxID=2030778 RepID=A0A8H4VCV0_9HYPO|nr:hypothetical protein GQ602_005295 [Ophiocordyceps camponoti-floridani]
MKFFATLLMAASVVLAAQEAGKAGKSAAGGYMYGGDEGVQANNNGPVPEAVKGTKNAIAAYQNCYDQRVRNDLKNLSCEDSEKKSKQSIADCICKNQDELSHKMRVSSNFCLRRSQKYAGIVREFAADVSELGLSTFCGAYGNGDNMMGGGGKPY